MERKRILFVAEAVTLAHVGRILTLARGLDPERYQVMCAWSGGVNSLIGDLPGPWAPLWSISSEVFLERLRRAQPAYDFATLDRYVRDELELFRSTQPDVVVGDTRLSLSVSAAIAGIPFFNVVNAHWSPFAQTQWIVPQWAVVETIGPYWGQKVFDLTRPLYFRAYAKGFNALLKKWGQPSLRRDLRDVYCAGTRTLYPDLRELVPMKKLPSSHRFLGPVCWSPPTDFPKELAVPSPGKKTVYVAMGSSGRADAIPAILEGLAHRSLRVVLATGSSAPLRNPNPANMELHVSPYFSGESACKTADLVIHNGGSGGVNQCFLAGVPFIGVALNLDQFSSMYWMERAGVGKTIRADRVASPTVARAVDDMLNNPIWRQRAMAIAEIARTYRPADILTEELEKEAGQRP
ncbi:MAG: glycosyl transferase family 1 [Elusimicrobia bacterium]|nr:glycosyl transferase family 1 [Elusimicrobiota bacterium]